MMTEGPGLRIYGDCIFWLGPVIVIILFVLTWTWDVLWESWSIGRGYSIPKSNIVSGWESGSIVGHCIHTLRDSVENVVENQKSSVTSHTTDYFLS